MFLEQFGFTWLLKGFFGLYVWFNKEFTHGTHWTLC